MTRVSGSRVGGAHVPQLSGRAERRFEAEALTAELQARSWDAPPRDPLVPERRLRAGEGLGDRATLTRIGARHPNDMPRSSTSAAVSFHGMSLGSFTSDTNEKSLVFHE